MSLDAILALAILAAALGAWALYLFADNRRSR